MNMRYGAAPTQTPPKPTSRPLTRFSPSMKTVRLSKWPSPSVSSKIRMRSLPCPSGWRGQLLARRRPRRQVGLLGMEPEVVEVEVPPVAGVAIDQTDEDLFSLVGLQIDGDAAEVFFGEAAGAREDGAGVLADEFDAG